MPWLCKLIPAASVSLSTCVFRRRPTLRIGTRTSFVRWSPRNYGRFMALNEASIKNRQCLMEATCMLSKKECKFHQHQLYTGTLSRRDLLCDAHGLKSLKSLKSRYSKSGYIGPTNAYSCSTSSRLYCQISCSLAQAEPGPWCLGGSSASSNDQKLQQSNPCQASAWELLDACCCPNMAGSSIIPRIWQP